MAFKSMVEYNDDRYGNMFMLRNDGDYADVIFLYHSRNDVMMAPTHYIKSDKSNGYVQCLGQNVCPACKRGIRVDNKLFIPLYDIASDSVLFWDRNTRFFQVLDNSVFQKVPDPSEFVFRITRHGASGDRNTRYEITVIAHNNQISYDEILSKFNIKFPEFYNTVCADWSVEDYESHLSPARNDEDVDVDSMPEYKISPRGVIATSEPDLPDFSDLDSSSSETESTNEVDSENNEEISSDIDDVKF